MDGLIYCGRGYSKSHVFYLLVQGWDITVALKKNNKWDLVLFIEGNKPFEIKWVFKKKFDRDGSV